MELSGGMELFCDVFENGEEHQHLPNIDPQQPLPELGRLPREKLDRAFRQLKKSMIQSYNSRIFFPQVSAPHFYPNPAAIEFHPNAQPLSIISAPSSAKSPHKIPTQKQIARRLTSCATAKSQQSHPPQQQQHQSLQQQQLQCYIDPAHFDHQQSYFHGTQFQQQLPPPTSTTIVPMHTPQQQLQPSFLTFAQYINQRNMALLDELRANETMLSNLLYTG
uniref:Uncharacterized protein n=1 Tax=Panagrolaimus davidi TaxID=227884 RepID=A0A914QF84_9BILA